MADYKIRKPVEYDTATGWMKENPILTSGTIGVEADTGRMKIGRGIRWSATPYSGGGDGLTSLDGGDADGSYE